MKHHMIFPFLIVGLALLCSCSRETKPVQPETSDEPLDIAAFSFSHTASTMEDCYYFELTLEEDGTRFYAEELFSGGRVVDRVIEEPVLGRLGKLAGTYRLAQCDGFDKTKKHVMDGSSFTLNITLADGSTVSAHGSNQFPDHYSEVYSEIRTLYNELMVQYADSEGKEDVL